MPNWCEGVLKIRGTKPKIAKYLQENLTPVDWFGNEYKAEVEYDEDSITVNITDKIISEKTPAENLPAKPKPFGFHIKRTRRAFIEADQIHIDVWEDDDDQEIVVTIENFKQAWGIRADNFVEGAKKAGVDLHIFGFEMGMRFTQEVEISKGNIIKDICNDKFINYEWDVPFSNLGG